MSLVRCGMMSGLDPSPWSVQDHQTPLHGNFPAPPLASAMAQHQLCIPRKLHLHSKL